MGTKNRSEFSSFRGYNLSEKLQIHFHLWSITMFLANLAEKFDFACLFKYLSIRGQAVSLLNEKGNAETFVNTMMKMKMPRYILILMFLNKELENNFFLELRNDFGIIFLKMTAIIKKKIIYRFTKSLSKCY
ncbi:hypothetical protein ACTA71_009633 [Dictyostelium dimigraforme]